MASAEQVQHLMAQMVEVAKALTEAAKLNEKLQVKDGPKDNTGDVKGFGERIQKKLDKWDGKQSTWADFKFQLKVAIGAVEPRILDVMEQTEKGEEEAAVARILTFGEDYQDASRWAKGLYEALTLTVRGDALTFMKGVAGQNGFEGWRKIHRNYSKITPARALMSLLEVVEVKPIIDETKLALAIEEWEVKAANLVRDYNEGISETMKVAIVTAMCPEPVRDIIFQAADSMTTTYKMFKDKLHTIIANRTGTSAPEPMTVNSAEVAANVAWGNIGDYAFQGEWQECEALDLNYLGGVRFCHNCGGAGHFARECPSAKGSGKGGKGGKSGKGDSNEGAKGKGKSKGFGMQWQQQGQKGGGKEGKGFRGNVITVDFQATGLLTAGSHET